MKTPVQEGPGTRRKTDKVEGTGVKQVKLADIMNMRRGLEIMR